MESGVIIRIGRSDADGRVKWQNADIVNVTDEEVGEWLKEKSGEYVVSVVNHLRKLVGRRG
jgi:hypothetical protein